MVQFNWEQVQASPAKFARFLVLASKQILKLALYRIWTINQSHVTNFVNAAKARLLFTANTVNYKFILSAPTKAEQSTLLIETDSFVTYVVTGEKKDLEQADAVLVFCHGGGYSIGHPLQYRGTYQRWIRKAESLGLNLAVVTPKYPMTPTYQYPAQLKAVLALYQYLVKTCKIPSRKLFIAGDSAGGNLAAALLLHLRDHPDIGVPGGGILISPWVDLTLAASSKSDLVDVDIIVNPEYMRDFLVPMLVGDQYKPADPRISPAFCPSVAGLPPQLVMYGTAEVLQEDSKIWIRKCQKDGVDVTTFVGKGGLHCFGMGGLASDKKLEVESGQVLLAFLKRYTALD